MKNLNPFVFTFVLLGTTSLLSFGQRLVTGRLVDKDTGKPIKVATITIAGTNIETAVNVLGFFQLQIDSVDQVIIKSPGYADMEAKIPATNNFRIELVKPDQSTALLDQENQRIYIDEYEFPCEKVDAKSYRIIGQHPLEPGKILANNYYMNGTTKETGTYSDKETYTRNGFFTAFYPNGKKSSEGYYNENVQVGKWTKWYKNGQICEVSSYENVKEPDQRLKVENFWDSLGNELVINGNGEYFTDEDDQVRYAKRSLRGGLKTGKWTGFFENGEVAYEEEYDNNKLIKGHSFDSTGEQYRYDKLLDVDVIEFLEFLKKNMKYPAIARTSGIQGKVVIHILVDPDERIIKSRIVKRIGGGCDEEAFRVVTKYEGKWHDGKKRGQFAKRSNPRSMYMPISFKLDK